MIDASVARRYSRALFSIALEEGRHEQTGDELEATVRGIEGSREALQVANDPGASTPRRQALVTALVQAAGLSPGTADFLKLLAQRGRLAALPTIARAYRAMLDEHVGRVRATVTSAAPLDDGQLEELRDTLSAATRKTIVLEAKTDPSIIGGVVAQVGAQQYDGSLRTQLERMREELKQSPL